MLILVVGCGSIGKRHIRNLMHIDAGRIIACDARSERARDVEEQYGVTTFDSFEQALCQAPDVALVCTPPSAHVSVALSAAQNGCHLFIEKPLSDSLDGIDELAAVVARNRLVTLVGCNMRFHPGVAMVKSLLEQEGVGRVLCARVQAGQYLPDWHPWEDYRHGYSANKKLGGGVILDGVHEIDYLRWLLGEVKSVFCLSGKFSSLDIDTEDMAEILLSFVCGAIAEVHLDYIQRAYGRSCQIIGEEGTILWDFSDNQVRSYSARLKEWQTWHQPADYDINAMYLEEMRHFVDCIREQARPSQDLGNARRVLEIALAAKQSSVIGRTISV